MTDLERSVAFYRDVLGLQEQTRFSFGDEHLVFLAAGAGFVELIADGAGSRTVGVVDHVALRVGDLNVQLERLHAADVRLLDETPVEVPALHARIVFCLGPDGERIELIER